MGLEANSAKIKDHGLTIGPWLKRLDFQWEGANSGPLQIQPKSRTMVWRGSAGGCEPLVLG